MAEDIIVRCSQLKITEDEESIANLDDIQSNDCNSIIELSLVGKVIAASPYNFEAFKRTMNQIWAISKSALFQTIENGLFVIQFAMSVIVRKFLKEDRGLSINT